MRAVVVREFGPPAVLLPRHVPAPAPGEDDVVLDVEIANVTFVDTQIRAGTPPHPSMLPELPAILGNGVGGVVSEVGEGADATWIGRRVMASLNGRGGYAERAVAASSRLVAVPDGVSLRDAVALLADGRTALSLARLAEVRAGETVLVEAAAGGVGSLLVQLAHNAGAQVVALAGGERKLALARELGADVAFDYREDGWARTLHDTVGAVDVVFDGVGGDTGLRAFGLLRRGGRFCPFGMASGSFAPVSPDDAETRGVEIRRAPPSTPEALVELTRAAFGEGLAGRLRPVIGQERALEDAAAAHAAIESRMTVGKTLLVVQPR